MVSKMDNLVIWVKLVDMVWLLQIIIICNLNLAKVLPTLTKLMDNLLVLNLDILPTVCLTVF